MNEALTRLIHVQPQGDDIFIGAADTNGSARIFGGHIAAQAVSAACHTVEGDRPIHSLHCYFLRPGKPAVPTVYQVHRSRDGRSFSSRHVTVSQDGVAIFELLASFHRPEPGQDWQSPGPRLSVIPDPNHEVLRSRLGHLAKLLDIRPVDPQAQGWDLHPYWFRVHPALDDHPAVHAAVLTYVSDISLMAKARAPGPRAQMAVAASIDHALWFHRLPRVDEWVLFSAEPVANIGTRGLVRGSFHDQSGALIATVVQEALLRPSG